MRSSSGVHGSPKLDLTLAGGRRLRVDRTPLVMGILNVTPDSFSDGGSFLEPSKAVDRALQMEEEGAHLIDLGGESTRPGADPVSAEQELERILPVLDRVRRLSRIPISIDTMKASVAKAALESGADMVNDVTALRFDPALVDVVSALGVPVILMHMRGAPKTMQQEIRFENLIEEIREELAERVDFAVSRGVSRGRILIDPGIGFGKTFDQNVEILARAGELSRLGPLVVGASRKGFVGELTGRPGGAPRMAGSLGAVAAAAMAGAAVVRVHDVAETVDFLNVFGPVLEGKR